MIIVILDMFHTYFIGIAWTTLKIYSWKPCRKVDNIESGVRKNCAFLQPCYGASQYYATGARREISKHLLNSALPCVLLGITYGVPGACSPLFSTLKWCGKVK